MSTNPIEEQRPDKEPKGGTRPMRTTKRLAAMSGGRSSAVVVEPFVLLYAIRYGLPRATYAHHEAIQLVIDHAAALRRWADTLIPDIRATEQSAPYKVACEAHCRRDHDRAVAALTDAS